jgi:hypothetical protein
MRDALFVQQGGRCYWCGCRCFQRYSSALRYEANNFTLDHVRPKSCGGRKRDPGNAVGACERCNRLRNKIFTRMQVGRTPRAPRGIKPETISILIESIKPFLGVAA